MTHRTDSPGNSPGSGPSHRVPRRGRVTKCAMGAATLALAGGGLFALAPGASATSNAPTHGKTTCAIAGDECTNAIAYANTNDGGGVTVLAVEADTEAHGGTVTHRVFDIRLQTSSGIFVEHVYRNDNSPYSDGIWWQSRAENQNPPSPSPSPSSGSDSPKITASQAEASATTFVSGLGHQVLGVKHYESNFNGQKDYFQVKLQLGQGGKKQGTTNVWVDASSTTGVVTAASGSGLTYRDANIVSPGTADANAVAATNGGSVYKTSLHGGKWRWYWVFVRNGSTKYKVGVDAVTGIVTQVRQS
ncbi:MAG: PepSY domain-containing protein [Acidimicrobiales bacterium]